MPGVPLGAMVLTNNPPVTGSKPIARGNSYVSSLLVGLGKGGKASHRLKRSCSQNHEAGEQRQGYPPSPSPKDPLTHRCFFVMDFSYRLSPGDVSGPASEHWGRRLPSCCFFASLLNGCGVSHDYCFHRCHCFATGKAKGDL